MCPSHFNVGVYYVLISTELMNLRTTELRKIKNNYRMTLTPRLRLPRCRQPHCSQSGRVVKASLLSKEKKTFFTVEQPNMKSAS